MRSGVFVEKMFEGVSMRWGVRRWDGRSGHIVGLGSGVVFCDIEGFGLNPSYRDGHCDGFEDQCTHVVDVDVECQEKQRRMPNS